EDFDLDLSGSAEVVQDNVDLDVLLPQQRVSSGHQEHRGEQIPLDLEEGVRAGVEGFSDRRVAGTDEHRRQNQPCQPAADELIDAVDPTRQRKQSSQGEPHAVRDSSMPDAAADSRSAGILGTRSGNRASDYAHTRADRPQADVAATYKRVE